jgi:hypothetical protein
LETYHACAMREESSIHLYWRLRLCLIDVMLWVSLQYETGDRIDRTPPAPLLIIVISNSEKVCSKFTFFQYAQAESRTELLITNGNDASNYRWLYPSRSLIRSKDYETSGDRVRKMGKSWKMVSEQGVRFKSSAEVWYSHAPAVPRMFSAKTQCSSQRDGH